MLKFTGLLVVCLGLVVSAPAQDRTSVSGWLPDPTGPSSVGRVTLHLTDSSRLEPLGAAVSPRELMVDVWYPSEPTAGPAASYLDVDAFERARGGDELRKQFGGAYDAIKAGSVRTHAVVRAPYASYLDRSPLLIFSPGGGLVREVYTAQMEELASHGYIAAAISHPYDAIVAVFPDDRHIVYDSERWPKTPSVEGVHNLNKLEWHADDIVFVLEELTRASEAGTSTLPFADHLDLGRVGAFGHSFGGVAAARACQKDRRFRACLNQDGMAGKRPFHLDVRGWGMDQPFMLIARAAPNRQPTDHELAGMRVTRQQFDEMMARLNAYQDRVMRKTGTGSYRVFLKRDSTTHMDFSDLPALGLFGAADRERALRVLAAASAYTRAFFDKHLKGLKAPLLEGGVTGEPVEEVQSFEASSTTNPLQ